MIKCAHLLDFFDLHCFQSNDFGIGVRDNYIDAGIWVACPNLGRFCPYERIQFWQIQTFHLWHLCDTQSIR